MLKITTIRTHYSRSISFNRYWEDLIQRSDIINVTDINTGRLIAQLDSPDVLNGAKRVMKKNGKVQMRYKVYSW